MICVMNCNPDCLGVLELPTVSTSTTESLPAARELVSLDRRASQPYLNFQTPTFRLEEKHRNMLFGFRVVKGTILFHVSCGFTYNILKVQKVEEKKTKTKTSLFKVIKIK